MTEYNRHGGLTLVATPSFEEIGEKLKAKIENKGLRESRITPTHLVVPKFDLRVNSEPVIQQSKEHIGGHDCVVLTSGPGTYEMLGQLFFLLGYLKGRRASRITVFCGYLPLARSDKDEGALELALAPHVIHLVKAAAYGELDRIITFDLHCPQLTMAAGVMGLITEVSIMRRLMKEAIEKAKKIFEDQMICVLFPDEGSRKQFEGDLDAVCAKLEIVLPRVYGTKRRKDDKSLKLTGLHGDVEALNDSVVLTIDDEITTAATNIATAQAVKITYHAKACWAIAIHGVLCGGAQERLFASDYLDKIFVTDSIPINNRLSESLLKSGRLEVVSCLDDLANIIYYHHWDENIRERRG